MSVSDSTPPKELPRWMSQEQLAWMVLLVAFGVFLVLAVSVPFGINWYLQHTTVSQLARIQGTSGVTLIESPGGRADPVAVEAGKGKDDVMEGSILRTDPASQASVVLFDRSTLTLFPNSRVTLNEMRKPRFGRSQQPSRISLTVQGGRVRVQVAPATTPLRRFEVNALQAPAPNGGIVLEPGSYAIETSNEMTHVSVRSGQALVSGQTGQQVTLQANERAEIALGTAAVGPLPAKRNLLVNSDFQNPEAAVALASGALATGWQVVSDQGGDGGEVDGTVEVVTTGTNRALRFRRVGSNNNHGETGVIQPVRKQVSDYLSLLLRLDVRLVYQSLSGGGEQSSEFPLIVRVDYRDPFGNPQYWTHGFYYQNTANYNILMGSAIPQDAPYRFEVDLKEALPNAQTIESVKLYASGWDWEVYVSEVELIAE